MFKIYLEHKNEFKLYLNLILNHNRVKGEEIK